MALIPDDPKQQKALVAGVVALAVLYFANSMWLSGMREDLQADQDRLEALQASNRQAQNLATRGGEDLEARMALFERHIGQLEQLIPAREQVAQLINQVQSIAREVGVEIQGFRPDGSEPVGAYTKETYAWTAVGEYHDIARFLTRVASMERIVTPVDMDIQPSPDPTDAFEDMDNPVLASFRLQTYVIPDEAAEEPLPAPGTGG